MTEMIPWIIAAICLMIAVAAVVCLTRKNKKQDANAQSSEIPAVQSVPDDTEIIPEDSRNELKIEFENLALLTDDENKRLVEIKDKSLISRIDNAIPGTLQAVLNTQAVSQYQQAVRSAGQLYQAIIPNGAVLTKSKTMSDALRGFYRGAKGIEGQANLVAVDGNMGKALAEVGVANAAMGVASMVVGQYYMSQINDKLVKLTEGIDEIRAFQDREFKSRVCALVAGVQKRSVFRTELIENDELRQRELEHLNTLEDECIKLLGQANSTLMDYSHKTIHKYEEYENTVRQAQKWYQYQQILLELLGRIEELAYALNLGKVSKEYCYNLYAPYAKQSESALVQLNHWHGTEIRRLKIDIESARRRRQGIDGFFMNVPALFDDNLHYKHISRSVAGMIVQQKSGKVKDVPGQQIDLFQEDVRLIAKDNKLYYLPSGETENNIS